MADLIRTFETKILMLKEIATELYSAACARVAEDRNAGYTTIETLMCARMERDVCQSVLVEIHDLLQDPDNVSKNNIYDAIQRVMDAPLGGSQYPIPQHDGFGNHLNVLKFEYIQGIIKYASYL